MKRTSRRPAGEPTPGSLADVQEEADPASVARGIVLRRLTAAPRTTKDLRDDLLARGIPDDVVAEVLDRYTELGLIDDAAYAEMWVSSRQRTKGTARSVLRQELRRKGVPDEAIDAAIDMIDDAGERARGVALVQSRLASTARLDPQVRERRLVAMLARRGYPGSVALGIVRECVKTDHCELVNVAPFADLATAD